MEEIIRLPILGAIRRAPGGGALLLFQGVKLFPPVADMANDSPVGD
jgi:hypothetical protein